MIKKNPFWTILKNSPLFSREDNAAWKRWVTFHRPECRDILKILSSDFRDGIKARALFLGLLPDFDLSPIPTGRRNSGCCCLPVTGDYLGRAKLSPALAHLAVDLTLAGVEYVKRIDDERIRSWCGGYYNNAVRELLSSASTEDGERLVAAFSLNDAFCSQDNESSSGYTPFGAVIASKNIPRKYKLALDARMRKIILSEIEGTTKPRADFEVAAYCYANIVQHQFYRKPLDLDLVVSQLEFILSLPGKLRIDHHLVDEILWVLRANKFLKLGEKLCCELVERGRFSVYDTKDKKTALLMRQKVAQHPALVRKVDELLDAYRLDQRTQAEDRRKRERAVHEIEALLK